jgi:AGCS family alanine or glycine:cation symporter
LIIINLKFIYGRDYWSIDGIVWSNALIVLCLGTGLYFSIRTRFLQVRHIREISDCYLMVKVQSQVCLLSSISNVISRKVEFSEYQGIHGCCFWGSWMFWMWMVAFLGASTAFRNHMHKFIKKNT